MSEKHSSFERVIGSRSPEERERILQRLGREFSSAGTREFAKEFVMEKTAEHRALIDLINRDTNRLRRETGLDDFDVPAENIVVFKDALDLQTFAEGPGAQFLPHDQVIRLADYDPINFTRFLYHEMVHFKSYGALRIFEKEQGRVLQIYRLGLTQYNAVEDKVMFKLLNEWVTEELTKRFMESATALQHPTIGPDIREIQTNPSPQDGGEIGFAAYIEERKIINTFLDKLHGRCRKKFPDREKVFQVFAEAAFTGDMLSWGRLIDESFEPGTTRMIGDDENYESWVSFMNSL